MRIPDPKWVACLIALVGLGLVACSGSETEFVSAPANEGSAGSAGSAGTGGSGGSGGSAGSAGSAGKAGAAGEAGSGGAAGAAGQAGTGGSGGAQGYCSDGNTDPGEVCDDGNTNDGDGCNSTCTSTEECGNNIKDFGEQCDGEPFCDSQCRDTRVPLPDADGDTIADEQEDADTAVDTDSDGTPDFQDSDSDNDGIPDIDETDDDSTHTPPPDTDGDGTPDFRDEDSDGDGIPDLIEGTVDTDGDGTPDFRDDDSDGDGIPDEIEGATDVDGDGILNFRDDDSDGDTITDAMEGYADPDGDGLGNFVDTDSDGDGIPDADEAGDDDPTTPPINSDSDAVPDYLDNDSDNDYLSDQEEIAHGTNPRDRDSDHDNIADADEGFEDFDGDGTINALDLDSDNDGVLDIDEAGDTDLDTYPVNTDGNARPDFLDLDSDADGLADSLEVYCSTLGRWSRYQADTDGDGFNDLAEWAVGSDLCDPTSGVLDVVEFYFELPYQEPAKTDVLRFTPTVKQSDVFFSVDTTGSMSGEISTLKSSLASTIIPGVTARVSNTAFGVGEWQDYPASPYGSSSAGDLPWRRLREPTTTVSAAVSGVNSLTLRNGNDGPESGYESLYQLATGAGTWSVPASVPAGRLGGAGFRPGSIPIALHITDAPSHVHTDYPSSYNAHSAAQAFAALRNLGVRVVTIHSDTWDTGTSITQLTEISNQTGARVPACAFKTETGSWRCGTDKCCTNLMSSTPAATNPVGGQCTLMYTIPGTGANLGTAVIDGIDAIVKYSTFNLYSRATDDGNASTIDTSCFLKRIEALQFIPPPAEPEASCTPAATPASFNGASYNNGFRDFATGTSNVARPGSQLTFTVVAENDTCQPPGTEAMVFTAFIDVVDQTTGSVLDTQTATIIVPPHFEEQ